VLATCGQTHIVLAKEHNEIFPLETTGGMGSPDDPPREERRFA